MPSRAVEAVLLTAAGIAATTLAFTLLKPYLFPQKAITLEAIKDNVESLALILDKRGGKFSPQTTYTLRSKGALLRLKIQTFVERATSQAKEYTLPLPAANTAIDELRSSILRGDPTPYANATSPTLVIAKDGRIEVVVRPVIHTEDCEYYGFKCKFIRIAFTKLVLEHAGKQVESCIATNGAPLDAYLNRTVLLPVELNYGKKAVLVVELLEPDDSSVKEVLGIPLRREFSLSLDDYGVFLVQYVFDELVIRC
jgi:hypothetical protein